MSLNLIEKAYASTGLTAGSPISANTLLNNVVINIVNPLIMLMVGVAIVYFLWGVFVFVRNADSPEERKKGGMHMLYGVLGLFIMATAYGIMDLILGTIGK